MAYKPQPGMRKHKGLIGDAIAEIEWLSEEMTPLSRASKNKATALHIARMENRALRIKGYLQDMLLLIQQAEATEE